MAEFPLHTRATAPFEAKPFLDQAGQSIGYVPALLAQMAEAPALLEGYATLGAIFRKCGFSAAEQQLVLLTVAVEHQSRYCTPAHAARARAAELDEDIIDAIRRGQPIADPRLEILRGFIVRMIRSGGALSESELRAFLDAGFTRANALEIILAIGLKTLSTYVGHIARTPLDPPLIADALTVGRRVA
ncbi:MAG: carboxymuconolactone decarboxylase family protein [Caulobacterales bacterium]|nr:carboxymuconolactone decarboxylase family protein [Caulobacterales bacterium]